MGDRSRELVGREREREELADALASGRPELIAVYGRRRVGKTYLVRTFFAEHLRFELTGMRGATQKQQLQSFAYALEASTGHPYRVPADWMEAFQMLIRLLESGAPNDRRQVVFFDKLPWLAGRRSGFLMAFEHFWNSWASRRTDMIVVICGSAASWMIRKVLHQRGGLYNRVTRNMALQPFQLYESEALLRMRGIDLDRPQIVELTMALGGIPYYLDYVRKGRSAAQNIEAIFFTRGAPLRDEFDQLFSALFEHYDRHLKVIRALARKPQGLMRAELLQATKLKDGGNLTTILTELETSGFMSRTVPFGHTERAAIYQLTDELTIFHLRWVAGYGRTRGHAWQQRQPTPAWQAWRGYAFETLCLKHIDQIKRALGIAGVLTESSAWRYRPTEPGETGAQIDLLIDRRDGVINLCEMKCSNDEFVIDKSYAAELRHKRETFRRITGTRKALFLTMVTMHGVKANAYRTELIQNVITSEALFEHG